MIEQEKQKKSKKKWILVGVLSLLGAGMIVVGAVSILRMREEVVFEDRGLPIINIELNGVELAEIHDGPKDVKYEGNELDLYEGNEILRYNDVEIKGRGNSTWWQLKKPYQIKFQQSVDLLGLGKAKKWVLLANYYDDSLIRNDISLLLIEMLGEKYNWRGDFVELYIDGDYRGLYYLVRKIEISKGSIDLRNNDGILFEIDSLHRDQEDCYESYLGDCLVLKDSVSQDFTVKKMAVDNFLVDFNEAEMAAKKGDYGAVEQEFNIGTFAEYFIINEFTVNPDAYSSSFYLYRDDNGKISAGPMWDFDFALANREWGWELDERFYSPYESEIRRAEAFGDDGLEEDLSISKLMYYLMEIPEFREKVMQIFQERMTGRKDEVVRKIIRRINQINVAAKEDGEKWDRKSFETETEKLLEWVKMRYEYFEKVYGNDFLGIDII